MSFLRTTLGGAAVLSIAFVTSSAVVGSTGHRLRLVLFRLCPCSRVMVWRVHRAQPWQRWPKPMPLWFRYILGFLLIFLYVICNIYCCQQGSRHRKVRCHWLEPVLIGKRLGYNACFRCSKEQESHTDLNFCVHV